MLNGKNEFYVVKCGYSEDGQTTFDNLMQRDIEILEATSDYELATRRLLYSMRWNNIYDIVWLEVYQTESNYKRDPYIFIYNLYGHSAVGETISLEMNSEQFDRDLDEWFVSQMNIEHYIPEGQENTYKRLLMEDRLLRK